MVIESESSLCGLDGCAGEESDHFIHEAISCECDAVAMVMNMEV